MSSAYSYSPTWLFPTFPSGFPTILTPLGPWGEQQAKRIELLTEASCSRRLSTSRWAASARWGGEWRQVRLRGEQGHAGSHPGLLPSPCTPQAGLGVCPQLPCHPVLPGWSACRGAFPVHEVLKPPGQVTSSPWVSVFLL